MNYGKYISLILLLTIIRSYSLTGVVKDELGNPLEGVRVSFASSDTVVTTSKSGVFQYHHTSIINPHNMNMQDGAISSSKNRVILTLKNDSHVSFEIFSLLGKRVFKFEDLVRQGVKQVGLPALADGMYVTRFQIGKEAHVSKMQFRGGVSLFCTPMDALHCSSVSRQKSRQSVDTVYFSHNGYKSICKELETYDTDLGGMVLQKDDRDTYFDTLLMHIPDTIYAGDTLEIPIAVNNKATGSIRLDWEDGFWFVPKNDKGYKTFYYLSHENDTGTKEFWFELNSLDSGYVESFYAKTYIKPSPITLGDFGTFWAPGDTLRIPFSVIDPTVTIEVDKGEIVGDSLLTYIPTGADTGMQSITFRLTKGGKELQCREVLYKVATLKEIEVGDSWTYLYKSSGSSEFIGSYKNIRLDTAKVISYKSAGDSIAVTISLGTRWYEYRGFSDKLHDSGYVADSLVEISLHKKAFPNFNEHMRSNLQMRYGYGNFQKGRWGLLEELPMKYHKNYLGGENDYSIEYSLEFRHSGFSYMLTPGIGCIQWGEHQDDGSANSYLLSVDDTIITKNLEVANQILGKIGKTLDDFK